MDPKSSQFYLAPGAAVANSYRLPGPTHNDSTRHDPTRHEGIPREEFPRIDDHVVEDETREEMVRGVRMLTMPAHPPHAKQHTLLDAVIATHAAAGYLVANDLLTRFSKGSNFASDVCVYRDGIDPSSGTRYLEELAFEVVSRQSRKHMAIRAEDMTARGVRRVIAIFVKTGTIEEWNRETGRFEPLDLDGELVDPVLVRPIALRGLLDPTQASAEIGKALLHEGEPVIVEACRASEQRGEQAGEQAGAQKAKRELLTRVLVGRFGELPERIRERIADADLARLDAWFDRALASTLDTSTLDAVFS